MDGKSRVYEIATRMTHGLNGDKQEFLRSTTPTLKFTLYVYAYLPDYAGNNWTI